MKWVAAWIIGGTVFLNMKGLLALTVFVFVVIPVYGQEKASQLVPTPRGPINQGK
jgi:hypothetical protein